MRIIGRCFAAPLLFALLGMPAVAEPQSESLVTTVLATGHLASVVALPVYFRLYRVHLPAAQLATYRGSSAMLYDLSGAAAIDIAGAGDQPLSQGAGAFVAGGQDATIRASASEPVDLLLFVLSHRPNQRPPLDHPAITKELYRAPVALPGLQRGPYEFTLARLTFPAGMQAKPPYYWTGAALNYILTGTGALTADGKTEAMPAGTAQAALSGWFHQWANPGDMPLVIVRASITQQGAAAVVPEPAK